MREGLDPWIFVNSAYAVTILPTLLLAIWSWRNMRRAEAQRDRTKRK